MKTWNQLFVRHGWLVDEEVESIFNCGRETKENLEFLFESLEKAGVNFTYADAKLLIHDEPINEDKWIAALSFQNRGRGEGLWFFSTEEQPKIKELDTFISGIVRQLNRLDFCTLGSCDGHERRSAHVMVGKDIGIDRLIGMLTALGMKRVYYRETESGYTINLPLSRRELLDLAEKMSKAEKSWLEKGYDYIKEQFFYQSLEELLSIPGASGYEDNIRAFVKERLTPFVDYITVDRHGNLLAEKAYRSGNGPTILLNAHLDTVFEIDPGREILKEGSIWTSSEGILGADDRAGVAIILHMAEKLMNSSFNGKVKYVFTIQEERGLVGARKMDDYFLWGTDAAFVIDRRGTGDIVTSCGGYFSFCDTDFGKLIENIAFAAGLGEWKCTKGGSSDTRIWAEHGIQSVNLSAGYGNEHSDYEYLDVAACYETTKLLTAIFENERELKRTVRRIQQRNAIKADLKRAN